MKLLRDLTLKEIEQLGALCIPSSISIFMEKTIPVHGLTMDQKQDILIFYQMGIMISKNKIKYNE
ncbi:hypothetical protein C6370_16335 [Bacillus atrophaeus]|nr:hypothetical protein C6W23_14480 [Bacillus atrophaeus]PSA91140.1 hypothetical protein C6370_16335 [Bacillus atrophaeus]